jgi:hypothetical protein
MCRRGKTNTVWKHHTRSLIGLFVGAAIGLKFPDIDHRIPFLEHRSLLTHSCLPILALLWWAQRQSVQKCAALRAPVIGFSLANAVHLSFDLFPRALSGPALIHIPLYGETSPQFSLGWLFASLFVCLWLALQAMQSRRDLMLGLGCLFGAYSVAAQAESRIALPACVVLLIAGTGAFLSPRRPVQI